MILGARCEGSDVGMLEFEVRFVHVALAFLAALASQLALKQWAIPRVAELAENKTYLIEQKVPWLFDGRTHGYSAADAKMHLDALGAKGREYYARWYIPVYDLIFPITLFVFGILFCIWMTQPRVGFAVNMALHWRLVILLVPLALFVFDILENVSVLMMLKGYPRQGATLVAAASTFTQAKWVSAYAGAVLAVMLLLASAFRWVNT